MLYLTDKLRVGLQFHWLIFSLPEHFRKTKKKKEYMKKLRLQSGEIPSFGLGTWKSAPGEVYEAVKEALRIGYRHIDCSPIYGNEKEIGLAFNEIFTEGSVKREDVWITSKLWCNAHGYDRVHPALTATLNDLQLDYLDLYLIHWPVVLKPDVDYPESGSDLMSLEEVPLLDTWSGMQAIHQEGLSRNIGVSNFSIRKMRHLMENSDAVPSVNQVEMHPYLPQSDLVSFCNENNIVLTAYSPLGSFDRLPQFKRADEPNLFKDKVINEIAEKHDCSPAQVLIKWAIDRGTSVIPKSVNKDRIKQNLEATTLILDSKDFEAIDNIDIQYRFLDGLIWTIADSPYTTENLWDE